VKYVRYLSLLFLVLIGVATASLFISRRTKLEAQTRAQMKRENEYQSALHFYNQIFKRSMTKKEVEDWLNLNKIEFFTQSSNFSSYDLIKIGEEEPPWYCGVHWVYVKLNFRDVEQRGPFGAGDEDTLNEIEVYHQLDRCL
jgi:hypothetical protein